MKAGEAKKLIFDFLTDKGQPVREKRRAIVRFFADVGVKPGYSRKEVDDFLKKVD